MKKLSKILLTIGLSALITSCVNTTVIPQGNKTFSVTATAETKTICYNAAAKKAVSICGREDKTNILDREIKYYGLSAEQVALIHDANEAFPQTENQVYQPTNINYQATLTFKCR